MTSNSTSFTPANIPDGRVVVGDKTYMTDGKGALVPIELIKPQHLLEDETVRKVMGYAGALSSQVSRFKQHTFEDLGDFDAMLEQHYGATKGGPKGNRTYQTYDGLMKIEIRVSDLIDFGPALQVGKTLLDECLTEWSADSRPEVRALITKTFNTDKEGQVNRALLFILMNLEVEDPRFQEAQKALREAIRVVGAKTYQRILKRDSIDAPWETVTIDLAKA